MNDLDGHPLVQLVWTQCWQIAVLAVIVGLLVKRFRRPRPHLAYLLWMLVLIKALTPPLWSSPTSAFSWLRSSGATATAVDGMEPSRTSGAKTVPAAQRLLPHAFDETTPHSPAERASPADLPLPVSVGLAVWLLGSLAVAGIAAIQWVRLRRVARRGATDTPGDIEAALDSVASRMGLRRRVRLVVTPDAVGPAVFGLVKPTIILPEAIVRGASAETVELLLAHELAHVRRGDVPAGLLQVAAQALWWFHPLVWWAGRRAVRAGERCCDEEVLARLGCPPANYARCLLDVLDMKQRLRALPLVPGMRPVDVTARRLERIMTLKHAHRRTPWWCWGTALLMATLVLPGAGLATQLDRAESSPIAKDRGPISSLPEDGAWVEHELELVRTRNGETTTRHAKQRIASVGRSEVDSKPARWIEFTLEMESTPVLRSKVLIPEDAIQAETTAVEQFISAWSQRGDEPPRKIDDPREDARGAPLNMLLPGKLTDAESLEDKTFEVKSAGKITAAGRTGRAKLVDRTGSDELVYRIWSNQNVPFGLVSAEVEEVSPDRAADRTIRMRLTDFGTGAKSEFRDSNDPRGPGRG